MRTLGPRSRESCLAGRRRLRGRRGVTDVPLELLIIIIILAIVVPIIVASLIAYTTDQQFLAVQEQAANIRDVAIQAFDDGINTTLLLSVTLPGGGTVVAGGPIFLPGSLINYQSTYIDWGIHGNKNYFTAVNNGAQPVLLTNISCNAGAPYFNYHSFTLPPGTNEIALTKLSPGAFFCGHQWPDQPTNATSSTLDGVVEMQIVP
jgi:type II secretory pathway pseudopilin PulG